MEIYNNGHIKINVEKPCTAEDYINFLLQIKAYQFNGEHNFCISLIDLKEIICKLNKLYTDLAGEVSFGDYDSQSFISLKMSENNQVCLTGQLGSEWEDNMWIFKQDVDQTIIQLLIKCFNNLTLLI